MLNERLKPAACCVVIGVALAVQVVVAIDVKVDFDKRFDFKMARSWSWKPDEPGFVRMARTPDDDPETMKKRAEPIIMSAVSTELDRRGLQVATAKPDLFVTYFLLLSTSASAQTVGQFLPSTSDWALPPFLASTQSLEIMNQGSLVLDFSDSTGVVWRGVAKANIKTEADDARREKTIRDAVRDLLKRFPPKS